MSLADREYARSHRSDDNSFNPPPKSKLWILILAILIIAAFLFFRSFTASAFAVAARSG